MDSEAWEKVQAPAGYWFVHQCGWGRRFDTEEDADRHIDVQQALTTARERAKVDRRSEGSGRAGRKRFPALLDKFLAPVLE
jgi:hypothetical protein